MRRASVCLSASDGVAVHRLHVLRPMEDALDVVNRMGESADASQGRLSAVRKDVRASLHGLREHVIAALKTSKEETERRLLDVRARLQPLETAVEVRDRLAHLPPNHLLYIAGH
jgi:hypothetical protein